MFRRCQADRSWKLDGIKADDVDDSDAAVLCAPFLCRVPDKIASSSTLRMAFRWGGDFQLTGVVRPNKDLLTV